MKRGLAILLLLTFFGSASASAHQPVELLNTDTTAARGPLLVDGTVSFAVRASFNKAGEKRAFRADFKAGDALAVQYLILDKKPENALKNTLLPQLVLTSPSGKSVTLKFTERTKFFEPYGKTNYLYLSRFSAKAEAGTYSFMLTSRAKSAVTIAVGEREVPGEVIRGAKPAPTPTPTPTATKASYTIDDVKKRSTSSACWSVIDGNVYDLTKWIPAHRGGPQAILFLCGKDGTSAYKAQHEGASTPMSALSNYFIGPLTP
jgi:cytochrome b involved in lipid metabolism